APRGQEGWTRHQENIAKLPLMERTGWWLNVFEPEPPPRLRRFGCFALLLSGAATPPRPEGLCPGPPSMFLRPSATKIQRRIVYLCSRSFSSDNRRFSRARVSSLFENDSVE